MHKFKPHPYQVIFTCALAITSSRHVEVSHVTKAAVARVGMAAM